MEARIIKVEPYSPAKYYIYAHYVSLVMIPVTLFGYEAWASSLDRDGFLEGLGESLIVILVVIPILIAISSICGFIAYRRMDRSGFGYMLVATTTAIPIGFILWVLISR